ncbi:FAD-dependent oxidoreductase [Puia dinghuensis]|uniref:Putative L-amino-acid oxidase YobN n=1 Tax=Puia dinghuensis TaxID=1792502 RepID=A0A8J2UKC1_9BACT|nr:FAD-dependent oxidoreductase [Puia dinghuensis]GGB25124.1 putative L-amino-acid oxidase YobN [Puia dinghuensis]
MERRDFLKQTLAAGVGLAVLPAGAGLALAPHIGVAAPSAKKVIVAGAGITGLCCGYELMKAGHDVVVLEASGRYGGHVYTGRDGLSDGLYADFGADHITKPGYERFFEYVDEFKLTAIPYPNAEGSEHAYDPHKLKVIDGKFYTAQQLRDPTVLKGFGFSNREVEFLAEHPLYELRALYLAPYVGKFADPYQPFGVGYDEYDTIPIADVYKKEGASPAALRFLGGKHTNALYALWRLSMMYSRGIPLSEGETFHLKDGNEQLPMAFARSLGPRVRLNHPVTAIRHSSSGVTVNYRPYGGRKGAGMGDRAGGATGARLGAAAAAGTEAAAAETTMEADVLVTCIPLPLFANIPITPALSPARQYVVDHLKFSSHPFYVFEAASKFWLDDGIPSINMEFDHPYIDSIWLETNAVETHRVILKAFGPGGLSPQQVLAAFRQVYPGKKDTIEQALTVDWTKDKYSPACEMEPFPIGEMRKFWPQVLQPEGRIYFAGTYADNMSRGMESCLRSAQRVAREIDRL